MHDAHHSSQNAVSKAVESASLSREDVYFVHSASELIRVQNQQLGAFFPPKFRRGGEGAELCRVIP